MEKGHKTDKERIIEILSLAFEQNQSVGYICGEGTNRMRRVSQLMEYAYKICSAFGKVVISADRNACAMVLFPDQKRFTLSSLWWDVLLLFKVIRIQNIVNVLKRERQIKNQHPDEPFYYLWFIGVHPVHKGLGVGSELMLELVSDAEKMGRPLYLETSTVKNLPWYKKFGLKIYNEINIGYTLYFLKREILN